MISAAELGHLRARAATPESPVLSVYLSLDQSRPENLNREFEAVLTARLRAIEHGLDERAREEFRADAERVRRLVAEIEPRAKTLVAFVDDSAGLFWHDDLAVPLATEVRWEPLPFLRPLLEALDEHERYVVVLVDKERARVVTIRLGEIEDVREALAADEVRHKKASGTDHWRSQMRFQRQDEGHVQAHLKQVIALLEEVAATRPFDRLVLAGPVEATTALGRLLPRALAARVVATLRLPGDAPLDRIRRETREAAARAERAGESTIVGRVLDAGVLGLDATLAALQAGRLQTLVYAAGFESRGAECRRCGALLGGAQRAACDYCGGPVLPLDDLVARVATRAGEAGATVEKVSGEAAVRLLDAGGIGGLARF
ncbi:MAG TPA: hypothetical protein VFD84_02815 [Candidatus Binatia bacterium]|nr:hypothetical protein [Candidatus Binatia bacterium]